MRCLCDFFLSPGRRWVRLLIRHSPTQLTQDPCTVRLELFDIVSAACGRRLAGFLKPRFRLNRPRRLFLARPTSFLAESVTIGDVVRRAPATDSHARRSELLRIFDNGLMELLRKVRKR